MRKLSQKTATITIKSFIAFLMVSVLVLSGVGIYFANKKPSSLVVNPLDWSTDVFDGEYDATEGKNDYSSSNDFANRGDMTYTIDSVDSFLYFISIVNDAEAAARDYNYFKDYTVYLNKNIDLNGYTIDSIGVLGEGGIPTFQGTFDGSYYTIFNANINGNGLFAYTRNATIKNIGLYNCTINSDVKYTGGILGYAENPIVSEVYIFGGSINSSADSNTTAGIIGQALITETYTSGIIANSFANTTLNGTTRAGLIGSIIDSQTFDQQSNTEQDSTDLEMPDQDVSDTEDVDKITLSITYSYYTNAGSLYANKSENMIIESKTVLSNPTRGVFVAWPTYKSEYDLSFDWCDYSYMKNSTKRDFNLPIQTGFNKVFMKGSFYENTIYNETTGEFGNAESLNSAIDTIAPNQIGEINIVVEKIYVDEPTIISADIGVNFYAAKETTLLRGENLTDAMIVVGENAKLALGDDESEHIIIDGNREYVEANNLKSSAAIVCYGNSGGEFDNVTICNNVNNMDGKGGLIAILDKEEANEVETVRNNLSALRSTNQISTLSSAVTVTLSIYNLPATSTLTGGSATYGGGLYASRSTLRSINILGTITNNTATYYGGGAYITVSNTRLSVSFRSTSVVSENTARSGGGIYYTGSTTLTIAGSIINNDATSTSSSYGEGGGIYSTKAITVEDTGEISGNTATNNGGGIRITASSTAVLSVSGLISENSSINGGGIYIDGSATLSLTSVSQITNNSATYGGGILVEDTSITISGEISGNSATNGGGIYGTTSADDGIVYISVESTGKIASNTANYGGGAYVIGSAVTLSGEISGNIASWYGGGLYIASGTATISGSGTISGNTAQYGGGIYKGGGTVNGATTSTVYNNTASVAGNNTYGMGYKTINLYSASSTYTSEKVYYLDTYTFPTTASKSGFTFAFWSTSSSSTSSSYKVTSYTNTTTSSSTLNRYAVFSRYLMAYDGYANEQTSYHLYTTAANTSTSFTVSPTSYTGYYFEGWVTSTTSVTDNTQTKPSFYSKSKTTISSNVASLSLTAIYSKYWYFYGYDKDYDEDLEFSYITYYKGNSGIESLSYNLTFTLPSNYVPSGYSFYGWSSVSPTNTATYVGSTVTSYNKQNDWNNYYAVYKKQITYYYNSTSKTQSYYYAYNTYGSKTLTLSITTPSGYSYVGLTTTSNVSANTSTKPTLLSTSTSVTSASASMTVYAVYSRYFAYYIRDWNEFTHYYPYNVSANASYSFSISVGTPSGYDFAGWVNDGTTITDGTTTKPSLLSTSKTSYSTTTASTKITAILYKNWYFYGYNGNDLVLTYYNATSASDDNTEYYTYTISSGRITPGFNFYGWTTESEGTSADYVASSNSTKLPSESITVRFYAVFTRTWTFKYGLNLESTYTIKGYYPYNVGANASYTKSYTPPAITGYTFDGWTTSTSGASASGSNATLTSTSSATFNATYSRNEYYLDLNGTINGNSQSNISGGGTANVYIKEPGDSDFTLVSSNVTDYYKAWPYQTEYKIVVTATNSAQYYVGTSSDCDQSSYTFTGTIQTSNVEVKPVFVLRTYWTDINILNPNGSQDYASGTIDITYSNGKTFNDMNNEPEGNDQISLPYGATITISDIKPATGYTLDKVKMQSGSITNNNNGSYTYTVIGTDVIIVQMKWIKSTLTINPNGGSYDGSTSNKTITQNYGTTYSLATPTRTGYTFGGWTLSGKGALSGSAYTFGAGAASLTAQWTAENYTVNFNANGGTLTGKTSVTTTYASGSYNAISASVTTTAPTGYVFAGWYTQANGGEQVYDASGNAISGTYWNSNKQWIKDLGNNGASMTLYAHWERQSYYLDILNGNVDGVHYDNVENIATANVWVKEVGSSDFKLVAENVTDYYIKWPHETEYKITITVNNSSQYFVGTSTDCDQSSWTFTGKINAKDEVIITYFKTRTYTVSFNVSPEQAGTLTAYSINNVPYGSSITKNSNNITINGTTITAIANTSDIEYSYSFAEWLNADGTITGARTITAQFDSTRKTGSIEMSFGGDGLGEVIVEPDDAVDNNTISNVNINEIIHVDGDVLTIGIYTITAVPHNADDQYTYTFGGWSVEDGDRVYNGLVITVTFNRHIKNYTVQFDVNDEDLGSVDRTSISVNYGTSIIVNANKLTIGDYIITATPTAIEGYTTTFESWTNASGNITGNRTIVANFDREINHFDVVINVNNTSYGKVNNTNSVTLSVPYNTTYSASGNTLVFNGVENGTITATANTQTDQYSFAFESWSSTSGTITGETTITANFIAELREYDIHFAVNPSDYGSVNINIIEKVPFGSAITINDNTISINGTTITATPEDATDEFTYKFVNWTNATGSVTGERTITANFTRTTNAYDVLFEAKPDGYGTVSKTIIEDVEYGTNISVNGSSITIGNNTISANPTTADDQYTYKFVSWSVEDGDKVVPNMTIIATFDREVNNYEVTINVNNSNYGTVNNAESVKLTVPYGTTFTTTKNTLTIADNQTITAIATDSEDQYSYTFTGWSVESGTITSNTIITANFAQNVNTYTIELQINNSEYGTLTQTKVENVPYGTAFSMNNGTLTIDTKPNATIVTANAKPQTAQFVFAFKNWTNEAGSAITNGIVEGNLKLTANFTATIRQYKVNIVVAEDSEGFGSVTPTTVTVNYDSDIIDNGTETLTIGGQSVTATPTSENYTFDYWTIPNEKVQGEMTISAHFARLYDLTYSVVGASESNDYSLVIQNKQGQTEQTITKSMMDSDGSVKVQEGFRVLINATTNTNADQNVYQLLYTYVDDVLTTGSPVAKDLTNVPGATIVMNNNREIELQFVEAYVIDTSSESGIEAIISVNDPTNSASLGNETIIAKNSEITVTIPKSVEDEGYFYIGFKYVANGKENTIFSNTNSPDDFTYVGGSDGYKYTTTSVSPESIKVLREKTVEINGSILSEYNYTTITLTSKDYGYVREITIGSDSANWKLFSGTWLIECYDSAILENIANTLILNGYNATILEGILYLELE